MHLRRERGADRILVLSGIVPAGVALWPIARRGSGTCACSRQFDGLKFQNQLRLRASRNLFGGDTATLIRRRRVWPLRCTSVALRLGL